MQIAFYANILAGEIDNYSTSAAALAAANKDQQNDDSDAASGSAGAANNYDDGMFLYFPYNSFSEDKLEKELNISCMDCRVPLVPFEEFYNEPLSDAIQMDRDYLSYKNLSLDPTGEGNSYIILPYTSSSSILIYSCRQPFFLYVVLIHTHPRHQSHCSLL